MPGTISSNLFADFLRAYEKGGADFAVVDGANSKVVRIMGGPLSGLKDLASKLSVVSAAFITANGTQALRGFRCFLEGRDVKTEESNVHFLYNDFGFYFSAGWGGEIRLRLGAPESADEIKIKDLRAKLDERFGLAYNAEPRDDKKRPLKFTRGYLIDRDEIVAGTKLAELDDGATGRIYPYWRSYRNLMLKPVLRALNEVFPLVR
jgi:hypothetical protein